MEALCLSSYISLASNNVVGIPKFTYGGPLTKPNKSLRMAHRPRGKRAITSAMVPPVTTSGNKANSVVGMHPDGIGIVKFFQGKSLLITGTTGFFGKVLIEKILRTTPDVHKIYVLIKAKNKEAAVERLKNEIIHTELFERLKEIHGKSYEGFMLSKLDPVVGTLCESNLGLDEDAAAFIAKEVDIIVNSAATTNFDERYDRAIDTNTIGPTRLMRFAKLCRKLKVFLQVSSAYANRKRQGTIMEKHFYMDESMLLNEKQPTLRVQDEIMLSLESKQAMNEDNILLKKMKELGRERANTFGWPNVYAFTKAMGEMLLESSRCDIPLVVMRPSVILSTYREPIPGWIQGNRMADPIIQNYGFGRMPGFLTEQKAIVDLALCLSSYISLASNNVVGIPKFTYGGPLTKPNKSLRMAHRPRGKRAITSAMVPPVTTSGNKANSVAGMHPNGIGIVKFFQGKSLLITGTTGFFGKVLIEKILRTTPDVHKIFVLIKAKNKEAAVERLKNEIIHTELFERLKEIHGKSYEGFMLSKLDPVAGTLCESNLGLDEDAAAFIAKEVDIIVNSAATTNFDERYDRAIDTNTIGPTRLMRFAKLCRKLKVFLQVSSAYANRKRQGTIMEKHFYMDESILLNEKQPTLRVQDEIMLSLESKQAMNEDNILLKKMKELGRERANTFGWPNVYAFTKAMGEMLLESSRCDIPLVVMRPSVILSTYREPIPGWIQGNRMADPIIQNYGFGRMPGFLTDPKAIVDFIPADMVVNAMLAAIAKHGASGKSESHIYQVGSSAVNTFLMGDLCRLMYEYFNSSPLKDSAGSPIRPGPFKFFSSMEDFSSYLERQISSRSDGVLSKKNEIRSKKVMEQVKHLAKMYEYYSFYRGRFDISNTTTLMGSMSEEERQVFALDIESLDWEDYIKNVHIPGLRKYVIKEK